MRILSLTLSAGLIACALCSPFCPREVTQKTVQAEVFDVSTPVLVAFHDSSEPDILDEASSKMEPYGICVTAIDCGVKANKKVCQLSNVHQNPTFNLYLEDPQKNPYTKKNFRDFVSVYGPQDMKSLERFVGKNLLHTVQVIAADAPVDTINNSMTPAVVLFTSKSTVNLLYRSVSHRYRKGLKFYQVRGEIDHAASADASLFNSYDITELPTLGVISGDNFFPFTGDTRSYSQIVEWLVPYYKPFAHEKPDAGTTDIETDMPVSPEELLTIDEFNGLFSDSDPNHGYVVAVTTSASAPGWYQSLRSKCAGAVKCAMLVCGNISLENESPAGVVCSDHHQKPFALTVPYSASARKKVLSNPSKWIHAATGSSDADIDWAFKKAQDSIPESVVKSIGEKDIDFLLNAALSEGTVAFIALSNKPSPSGLIRNVATSLSSTTPHFVYMPNPSVAFMKNLGDPVLPTIVGMFAKPTEMTSEKAEFQVMFYDPSLFGPLSFPSISGFVVNVLRQMGVSPSQHTQQSSDTNMPARNKPVELIKIQSTVEWETMCGESFRGICAVAFVDSPHDSALDVFQAAMKDMSLSSAFNFVWVDASCQVTLAEAFEVSGGGTPALAVYSPLKNRFARFIGSFTEGPVRKYMEDMAAGRITTFPLRAPPVYDDKAECLTPEDISDNESVIDTDDFLAEIRREEAERAAELKKAVEEERLKLEEQKKASTDALKKKKKRTKKRRRRNLNCNSKVRCSDRSHFS